MICPLHAWGDESIRTPMYLLGASVIDSDDSGTTRNALESLRPTHGKLHWHDLTPRDRRRVAIAVAGLDAQHLVVIASPLDPRREERARAMCLERLTWELADRQVERLVLEARSRPLMERDLRTVRGLRGRRVVPATLRVEHGNPDVEPLLWLPDQVLGMYAQSFTDRCGLANEIGRSFDVFDVEP